MTSVKKLWPGDIENQQRCMHQQTTSNESRHKDLRGRDGQSQTENTQEADVDMQLYTHPSFPYNHYIHHFAGTGLNKEANGLTPQRFYDVYRHLLKTAGINPTTSDDDNDKDNNNADSYNLGFTKDWIVIAKRITETVYPIKQGTLINLHDEKKKGSESSNANNTASASTSQSQQDGKEDIEEDQDQMIPIPGLNVNGTILGGMILTRTEMELNKLMDCNNGNWKTLFGGLGVCDAGKSVGGKEDSRL